MRTFWFALFVGGLLLVVEKADAREWVSRDGRFTVEAELLTVDAAQVVLRREGGSVIRVPLERLSLSDVKYVQEAMQAAGMPSPPEASPAAEAPSTAETVTPQQSPKTSTPPPTQTSEPGPPIAKPGVVKWQAAPDPALQGYDLKPGATVEIPVSSGYSRPFTLFPSSPSPFVLLGSGQRDKASQLWDLRTEQAVGEIDVELSDHDKLALSPDGQHLAYHNYNTRGEVRIWSFSTGSTAHSIKLPEHSTVRCVRFAGSQRVILAESKEDNYRVYDVDSGEHRVIIDVEPQHDDACQVVSPGGNYLVVHADRQLAIYDTRNGVRAGRLKAEVDSHVRPECLVFSDDGKELAGYFRDRSEMLIHVWDMKDGESLLTTRFAEDAVRKLGYVRYHGGVLQWLADGSGWLLSGVAVIDRSSGQIIWQDQKAITESDVLPRRIVDAERMLSFHKEKEERSLRLISIPKEEIANSRAIVEAGGSAADAGLPPTTAIDMKGAKKITLVPGAWEYRAAVPSLPPKAAVRNRVRLASRYTDYNRAFFSRPDVARVAIGERLDDKQAPWKAAGLLPQACQLYDLQSGQQVARFEIPFAAEFIDLSPDGKLGLFRIDRGKDRLDIWDLTGGQHVLAFRPYDGAKSHEGQVAWAGFVDENHLVTLSSNRKLIAWKIPECQAVYEAEPRLGTIAGRSRDRQTMVVMSGNTPHLINALSGNLIGTLPDIQTEETVILPRASFSPDENRLAVLSSRDEGCLLVAWDLTDGSRLMKSELPFDTYGLMWCGPNHVLVNRSSGSDDPDTLIDVERGLAVWNYETVSGACLRASPDHRGWFCCPSRLTAPSELVALELPGEEVQSFLSRVQFPAPLIGPGATVTVQTQIENPPQAIPPGWAGLENPDEGLYQHFSKQLQDRRANVVARGTVRLIAGIDQKKMEETMSVGGLFGPSRKLLLSATLLTPYVAVLDSAGNRIWSKQPSKEDMEPVDLDDCPEGMAKETFIKLHQWEKAVGWLRSVEIPYPLFHPNVHRGFGDSMVTPEGTKIRRSPSPSKMKTPNRTARISAPNATRPG